MLKNYENPETDDSGSVERARDLFMEDLFKLTDDLKKFTKYKQYFPVDKRDINKFTPTSLFTFINNFELPEKIKSKLAKSEVKKEIRKERKGFSHPGGTVEYVGDNYTVIKISDGGEKGQEAASWYGGYYDYANGESRWCTSPPSSSYFRGYVKDGPLYVLLSNDESGPVGSRTGLPQDRYQFHFPSNQFMDRLDHRIELVEFLNNKAPDLKEYFKPEFAKGLVNQSTNQVNITYPDSSAGKFVALYGFEELFESLPRDIEMLSFINKSKEDLAIDIPSSIGEFKNLSTLQLENIVKSLPDELGNLVNLGYLILPNNKQLKSLPNSIEKLKDLTFLNIYGCGRMLDVTLPQSVRDSLIPQGNGYFFLDN
jgi:Leucine-rich repeat (LRR) protein